MSDDHDRVRDDADVAGAGVEAGPRRSVDGVQTEPRRSADGGVYGPSPPPESGAEESVVYAEFGCEDVLLASVFDRGRPDRWIQTTVVVPVEE